MQDKTTLNELSEGSIEKNPEKEQKHIYFTTTTFKLMVMSICTLGIYQPYWFYKNWVLIKKRTGQNIMPFWRAFFAPLWAYSCFKHIKSSANENGISESLPIGLLAIVYFLLQATWKLPDPYWLISFISFTLLIPANSVALKINNHLISGFDNNKSFSGWNWAAVVIGGLLFIASSIVTILPEKSHEVMLTEGLRIGAYKINKKLPMMVDQETRLDKATVGPGPRMVYHFTFLNHAAKDINANKFQEYLKPVIVQKNCTDPKMKKFLQYGGIYEYAYSGNNGVEITRFDIDRTDCGLPRISP